MSGGELLKPVKFSIIGGAGFRAQYYLRIAQAMPERFQVSGTVVRNETKALGMEKKWGVSTYRTLDQMLQSESPDFIVVSVSGNEGLNYLCRLAEEGIPVLTETPPAPGRVRTICLSEGNEEKSLTVAF